MSSSGKQRFWKARRSSNDPRSHCSYSCACSRTGIRSWSGRIASLQSAIALNRQGPIRRCPARARLPLHGDPCPGLRALGPCGLGKAGQRDETAPLRLLRKSDPHGLRQVGDVVDRFRFRVRLHAFQAQREAPHHGLQDALAAGFADHHAGITGRVSSGRFRATSGGVLTPKCRATSAALFLTIVRLRIALACLRVMRKVLCPVGRRSLERKRRHWSGALDEPVAARRTFRGIHSSFVRSTKSLSEGKGGGTCGVLCRRELTERAGRYR